MKSTTRVSSIESLLFVQGEPVQISRLMAVLDATEEEVLQSIDTLQNRYSAPEYGITLITKDESVQMVSKGENASVIDALFKNTMQESLSKAAMEVLSVIAYRGPIARSEIEAIRGVNCSATLRNLLMRELIERDENENDAREYLYTVSFQFLRELGLQKVSDLPDYETMVHDARLTSVTGDSHA